MYGSFTGKNVLALLTLSAALYGQAQPQQRVLGVVTEKQGSGAKLKTDAGEVYTLVFAPETKFQKIAPGETSLKNAQTISSGDLSEGDRVLARGTGTDPKTVVALSVVVMSRSDIAEKQQKEHADWQSRGISGTVVAVNPNSVTIRLPSASTEHLVTVEPKQGAPLRRYSTESVRFADSKIAPLSAIQKGDQLRARGEKNEDGTRFTAEEVLTGSFQTLAAIVNTVNAEGNEMQIKDLDTNRVMTVKVTADSTLKRAPQVGGMRGGAGAGAAPGADGDRPVRAMGGIRPTDTDGAGAGRPAGAGPGGPGGPGGGGRGPDLSAIVERAPATTLAEVKPGETIIIAGIRGGAADHMTAVTVLAGADGIVAARRAMAARAAGNGQGGSSQPQTVNWNLGDMSTMPTQ